jgi:membrane protein DedA with SNARE-associated domain
LEETLASLSTYGYVVLFLYSLGGGFVALVAAGVLSYAGKMDIATSIIIATVANFLGDMLLFYLARYNKEMFGPYLKKQRRKIAYSTILMKKYGNLIIFFQKFVYGIKTLIPIAIGLTSYSFTTFGIYNAISSVIWGLLIGFASLYAGEYLMRGFGFISDNPIVAPIILLSLIYALWTFLERKTRKLN